MIWRIILPLFQAMQFIIDTVLQVQFVMLCPAKSGLILFCLYVSMKNAVTVMSPV